MKNNKPENPKPPINLASSEKKHYSVYDKIAARRKSRQIYSDSTEMKFFSDTPLTEEESANFISQVTEIAHTEENQNTPPADFDEIIEEICEYYRKKYSRKMWITLICSLCFFCILIALMYLYINGYFS